MAGNLLNEEFAGSTLAALSSLGVAAFDEEEHTAAVLEQARVRAATGVNTTASIPAIEAVKSSTEEALTHVASEISSRGETPTLLQRRDALRMRLQLLVRLLKTRKIGSATPAAAASSGTSNAAAVTTAAAAAGDVLASLGRQESSSIAPPVLAPSVPSRRVNFAIADDNDDDAASTALGFGGGSRNVTALPHSSSRNPVAAVASADGAQRPCNSRRRAGFAPLQIDQQAEAKAAITSRGFAPSPVARPSTSTLLKKKRTSSSSSIRSDLPSNRTSSSSSGTVPPAAPVDPDAISCPICSRVLASSAVDADMALVNRHIDRCLRRGAPSADNALEAAAAAALRAPLQNAASPAADAGDDGLFDVESDGDAAAPTSLSSKPLRSIDNVYSIESSDDDDDVVLLGDESGEEVGDSNGRPSSAAVPRKPSSATSSSTSQQQRGPSTSGGGSSARGRLTSSDRSGAAAGTSDDWHDVVYNARVAAAEEEEDEAAAAAGADTGDTLLEGGLKIPHRIASALFPYQMTGVQWLWGLHRQRVGGILGDEMGLGKTVQVAALVGSLSHSGLQNRPSLIVCPATVIAHWVRELHTWWPRLRVIVLHESGSAFRTGARGVKRSSVIRTAHACADVLVTTYESLRLDAHALQAASWGYAILDEGHRIRNPDAAVSVAARALRTSHRLILTGAPIQNRLKELWSLFDFVFPGRLGSLAMFESQFAAPIAAGGWTHATALQTATAYQCAVVLRDLIGPYLLRRLKRDVNAHLPTKTEQVLFCRLSASQRDAYLRFLRSEEVSNVMDGRMQPFRAVTTLRKICNHAELGSSNSGSSAGTAGSRARSLLLRSVQQRKKHTKQRGASSAKAQRSSSSSSSRFRTDSNDDDANMGDSDADDDERELFDDEDEFDDGEDEAETVHPTLSSRARTAATHSLIDDTSDNDGGGGDTGAADAASLLAGSGKLGVLAEILRLWTREGHRALLFCQGRTMLNLLERFVSGTGYSYLRMDGTTPIRDRQALVDKFNKDEDVFLFLLTTRVGGVGVNLIGADRVVIFDPDWNPSTDLQARERAWRLGQKKHVTVYRLITSGTIEEKIYHRQIFKTVLTQKVLSDPGARRLFNYRDMRELFTLSDMTVAPPPPAVDHNGPPSGRGGEDAKLKSSRAAGRRSTALKLKSCPVLGEDDDDDDDGSGKDDEGDESATTRATQAASSSTSRHRPTAAAAATATEHDTKSLELAGLVAGHETYLDPDARYGSRVFIGAPIEEEEEEQWASDDDENDGSAKAGASQQQQRGQASSQTAVLQAMYGQGGQPLPAAAAAAAADASAGALSSEQAVIRRHAERVAREALRFLAPTMRPLPSKLVSAPTAAAAAAAAPSTSAPVRTLSKPAAAAPAPANDAIVPRGSVPAASAPSTSSSQAGSTSLTRRAACPSSGGSSDDVVIVIEDDYGDDADGAVSTAATDTSRVVDSSAGSTVGVAAPDNSVDSADRRERSERKRARKEAKRLRKEARRAKKQLQQQQVHSSALSAFDLIVSASAESIESVTGPSSSSSTHDGTSPCDITVMASPSSSPSINVDAGDSLTATIVEPPVEPHRTRKRTAAAEDSSKSSKAAAAAVAALPPPRRFGSHINPLVNCGSTGEDNKLNVDSKWKVGGAGGTILSPPSTAAAAAVALSAPQGRRSLPSFDLLAFRRSRHFLIGSGVKMRLQTVFNGGVNGDESSSSGSSSGGRGLFDNSGGSGAKAHPSLSSLVDLPCVSVNDGGHIPPGNSATAAVPSPPPAIAKKRPAKQSPPAASSTSSATPPTALPELRTTSIRIPNISGKGSRLLHVNLRRPALLFRDANATVSSSSSSGRGGWSNLGISSGSFEWGTLPSGGATTGTSRAGAALPSSAILALMESRKLASIAGDGRTTAVGAGASSRGAGAAAAAASTGYLRRGGRRSLTGL